MISFKKLPWSDQLCSRSIWAGSEGTPLPAGWRTPGQRWTACTERCSPCWWHWEAPVMCSHVSNIQSRQRTSHLSSYVTWEFEIVTLRQLWLSGTRILLLGLLRLWFWWRWGWLRSAMCIIVILISLHHQISYSLESMGHCVKKWDSDNNLEDEYYHDEEDKEFVGGQKSSEPWGHSWHYFLVIITNRRRSSVRLRTEVIASPEGHGGEIEENSLKMFVY